MDSHAIVIVSGLPRSGTSLMMQMLQAGGVPMVSDGLRTADSDNPRGYCEFEAAKKLKQDSGWLANARGKVVKVISMLLYDLPPGYEYRVIFMHRHMDEILASQKEMLKRRGTLADSASSDAEMKRHFESHLKKIQAWLAEHKNFHVLDCHYNDLLREPTEHIRRIRDFIGPDLDAQAMEQAIDRGLHRNRAPA